jgi:hypothetical protein
MNPDPTGRPSPAVRSTPRLGLPQKNAVMTPAPKSTDPKVIQMPRVVCGDVRNQPRSRTSPYIWSLTLLSVEAKCSSMPGSEYSTARV